MKGFITDSEMAKAEQEFPGIAAYFDALQVKPRTFLELVALFDGWIYVEPQPTTQQLPR